MALRKDRRGVLSAMDAMAFLAIMIVVCAGFFAHGHLREGAKEPLAKAVAEDFLSVELLSSDVYPTEDSQAFPIADLIAVNLVTGRGDALDYAETVLDGMVPRGTRYGAVFEYGSARAAIGETSGMPSSEYSCEKEVAGGGLLKVTLRLY
ncbi:MAG: hypothetical protein GX224_04285 [Thermoplasmatales archaeon]|nr:hypothetical protein [Thermoplasmatales archaeon]